MPVLRWADCAISIGDIEAVDEVYKTFFPDTAIARTTGYFPARTVIAAAALPVDSLKGVIEPGALLEMPRSKSGIRVTPLVPSVLAIVLTTFFFFRSKTCRPSLRKPR